MGLKPNVPDGHDWSQAGIPERLPYGFAGGYWPIAAGNCTRERMPSFA